MNTFWLIDLLVGQDLMSHKPVQKFCYWILFPHYLYTNQDTRYEPVRHDTFTGSLHMALILMDKHLNSSMTLISALNFCLCQLEIAVKQECIPVGCVPSAAVAVCWGSLLPAGVSAPGWGSATGGWYPSMH